MIIWLFILLLVIIGILTAKTLVWAVIIGTIVILALSRQTSIQSGGSYTTPWWRWGRGWNDPSWSWSNGMTGLGGWGSDWSWGPPALTYSQFNYPRHYPRHVGRQTRYY